MEPKNFSNAEWQFCKIVNLFTSKDAIEAGVINQGMTASLLFFFLSIWTNKSIYRWLINKDTNKLRENRMIILIGCIYSKGIVFEANCYSTTIANLMLRMNVLENAKQAKTIRNILCMSMPKELRKVVLNIFEDTICLVSYKWNVEKKIGTNPFRYFIMCNFAPSKLIKLSPMIQNSYRVKTIRGQLSSVGPLQKRKDGELWRLLTFKTEAFKETLFVSAYLVGDIANDCTITFGTLVEISYKTVANGERVIIAGI